MKRQNLLQVHNQNKVARSAKECAYLAVFVALVIAGQTVLSAVPGVEIVTVLFVSYAFVMGVRRGVIASITFAFLRQFVFGIYPTVLILYLSYFPLLCLCFGWLGMKCKQSLKHIALLVGIACVCTACFTMMDNVLTPLWYGYSERSARLYFMASLPFMIPQIVCTAVTVACLFAPLCKVFRIAKKSLYS